MTQEPCGESIEVPPPPPVAPHHHDAAGWVFLAALMAIVVFDAWAAAGHHTTISQWVRRTFGKYRWWRPFAAALIGLTLVHLFLGGPL